MQNEFSTLLADLKEQVLYLQELGVDNFDVNLPAFDEKLHSIKPIQNPKPEIQNHYVLPDLPIAPPKSEPKVSPSDIMQIIKSISARNFFKLYPQIKRKYFWGGKLWTQSFFVETVGNANDKIIREYVQNQLNAMDKMEKAASQLKLF